MGEARVALTDAAAQFGFSATPRLDAELLLAHALGILRERLLLSLDDHDAPPAFADFVERRVGQEPVAYITGSRAFWTIELHVAPGVLIPRADTETLIEAAVAHFARTPGPARVLDLGTGSGALLLAALGHWSEATGIGLDESFDAIPIARANVRRLGMVGRAKIKRGGWLGMAGPHDLILCNPPYVAERDALPPEVADWEPATALFAGPDGLDAYRMIAPVLRPQLAPGGVACIEIGADQARAAAALFHAEGLSVTIRRDLGGRERCLAVTS